MSVDHEGAEAFSIVAARKIQAVEDCLKHRAYPTACENLEAAARAIERAKAALGA